MIKNSSKFKYDPLKIKKKKKKSEKPIFQVILK